jgi:hypothetical protein
MQKAGVPEFRHVKPGFTAQNPTRHQGLPPIDRWNTMTQEREARHVGGTPGNEATRTRHRWLVVERVRPGRRQPVHIKVAGIP